MDISRTLGGKFKPKGRPQKTSSEAARPSADSVAKGPEKELNRGRRERERERERSADVWLDVARTKSEAVSVQN